MRLFLAIQIDVKSLFEWENKKDAVPPNEQVTGCLSIKNNGFWKHSSLSCAY